MRYTYYISAICIIVGSQYLFDHWLMLSLFGFIAGWLIGRGVNYKQEKPKPYRHLTDDDYDF